MKFKLKRLLFRKPYKKSVEDVSAEKSQVAATPVEEDEEDGPLEDWTVKELKD